LEVEERGGLWLDANENIHDLLPMVSAVAAVNSNLLFEAAMCGKQALSFGGGPHAGRGFTVDMSADRLWPTSQEQSPEEWAAVCQHASLMELLLTPEGAWSPGWRHETLWAYPFWRNAREALIVNWHRLLHEEH
jgi:hypothetical protein